jgi:hypothetical protein
MLVHACNPQEVGGPRVLGQPGLQGETLSPTAEKSLEEGLLARSLLGSSRNLCSGPLTWSISPSDCPEALFCRQGCRPLAFGCWLPCSWAWGLAV